MELMTREAAVANLQSRPNGRGFRWVETRLHGEVKNVTLEHRDRPEWKISAGSWRELISILDSVS